MTDLEKLQKQVAKLQEQVDKLLGVRSVCDEDKRITALVLKFLNEEHHALTHDTDMIMMQDLVRVMTTRYPEEQFFTGDPVSKAKRLGALMGKEGTLKKMKVSYHVPADKHSGAKHSNVYKNVWVLRNAKKYANLGPADRYREYMRQLLHSRKQYTDIVEPEPSFM